MITTRSLGPYVPKSCRNVIKQNQHPAVCQPFRTNIPALNVSKSTIPYSEKIPTSNLERFSAAAQQSTRTKVVCRVENVALGFSDKIRKFPPWNQHDFLTSSLARLEVGRTRIPTPARKRKRRASMSLFGLAIENLSHALVLSQLRAYFYSRVYK